MLKGSRVLSCRIGFGRPKPPVVALPVRDDGCPNAPNKAFNESVTDIKESEGMITFLSH